MRRLVGLAASGALLATGLLGVAPSAQATDPCAQYSGSGYTATDVGNRICEIVFAYTGSDDTTGYTWTIPQGPTGFDFLLVGGGGGGGGGKYVQHGSDPNLNEFYGGGGGGGGVVALLRLPAAQLQGLSTLDIYVGRGGAGGAAGQSGNSGFGTGFANGIAANGGDAGSTWTSGRNAAGGGSGYSVNDQSVNPPVTEGATYAGGTGPNTGFTGLFTGIDFPGGGGAGAGMTLATNAGGSSNVCAGGTKNVNAAYTANSDFSGYGGNGYRPNTGLFAGVTEYYGGGGAGGPGEFSCVAYGGFGQNGTDGRGGTKSFPGLPGTAGFGGGGGGGAAGISGGLVQSAGGTGGSGVAKVRFARPVLTVDCNPGGSGTGTLSDPYIVTNAVQLAAIDDDPSCMAANYVQTADINLTGQWTPLGASPAGVFSGVYHGGCKAIDGLTIGTQGSPYNGDAGLFRELNGATVRNVQLRGIDIVTTVTSGTRYSGGLVAVATNTAFTEISVTGSVTGRATTQDHVLGLLAGDVEVDSQLTRIHTSGTVDDSLNPQDSYAGGIAGASSYNGNGAWDYLVESASSATVSSTREAGGLVGYVDDTAAIRDSTATGAVTATDSSGQAGGLVSSFNSGVGTVQTSYATGRVTSGNSQSGGAGGLVGGNDGSYPPVYVSSFWDTQTTGQVSTTLYVNGVTDETTTVGGKTTVQMQTASTFTTWDPAVWNITNGTYPTLKWIDAGGVPATCPQVTSVSPSSGAAGDQVIISGVGFTGATSVTFGGVAATNVTIVDDTTMTATVPAGSGSVAVAFQPAGAPVGTSGSATISLPVASKASAFTFGSAPGPTPDPVFPPSAPRDVTAVPGDRSAFVSWREPASAGSFPVSTYKAIASPGGASCLTVAPSLSCTVAGLTNGTAYTFTVEALNGAGWSPAGGPSSPVTPGGVTPAPQPVPIPTPLAPGDSLLQTNGAVDPNVTVDANTSTNGLVISGDGWRMDLDGLGPDGKPLSLGPDGSLRLANERDVATEGSGFLPNSEVDLYVDPPVQANGATTRAGTRADAGIYVGTVRTNASGNFSGTATLPEDITPGDHVLQAVGYSPTRQSRAMSLGVVVEQWIVLDKGSRKPAGVHDRMRTTGASGGIDAGTKLTPHIRYAGQSSFSTGVATITVKADGSFTWSRLIRKDRGLTAYVSYLDTESNRVVWARVR